MACIFNFYAYIHMDVKILSWLSTHKTSRSQPWKLFQARASSRKNGRTESSALLSSLQFLAVSQVNCNKTTGAGLTVHYCYHKSWSHSCEWPSGMKFKICTHLLAIFSWLSFLLSHKSLPRAHGAWKLITSISFLQGETISQPES